MTNYYHNRFGKKVFPLCRTRLSKNIYYVNLLLLFFFFLTDSKKKKTENISKQL